MESSVMKHSLIIIPFLLLCPFTAKGENLRLAYNLSVNDYDIKRTDFGKNPDLFETAIMNLVNEAQAAEKRNFYSIEQLNYFQFSSGTYETEGYVVKAYECPDCPPTPICKLCLSNNIIISTESAPQESGPQLSSKDLIVFVDPLHRFQVGSKYKFLIQILDVKSTTQILNNVKLIYYEKLG
jgi:hypothetical protein